MNKPASVSVYDNFIKFGLSNGFKQQVLDGGVDRKITNIKQLRELGFPRDFAELFGSSIGLKEAKDIVERILDVGPDCLTIPTEKTVAQLVFPVDHANHLIALGKILEFVKSQNISFDFTIQKISGSND